MNDTLDLERRLHEYAAGAPAPHVPLEEDLDRGRRRLRLQRLLVTGAAVAGVAVIALGVAVTQSVVDKDSSTAPASAPTASPTAEPSPTPKASEPPTDDPRIGGELLQAYRDVVAEHLDPDGTHLQKKPDNLQSGGGLGTKLGWTNPGESGLGMVEIFVGDGWGGFVGELCGGGRSCTQRDIAGVHATVSEDDTSTRVLVKRDDGSQVLIAVDLLFGNNSTVPLSGVGIAVDDLIRAAGDERLVEASPKQIRNAGTSMGFPDPPTGLVPPEEGQSEAPAAPR